MNDVNELWSSPWRKLQKNLASGFGADESVLDVPGCELQAPGSAAASTGSWLVRARSVKMRVTRVIQ